MREISPYKKHVLKNKCRPPGQFWGRSKFRCASRRKLYFVNPVELRGEWPHFGKRWVCSICLSWNQCFIVYTCWIIGPSATQSILVNLAHFGTVMIKFKNFRYAGSMETIFIHKRFEFKKNLWCRLDGPQDHHTIFRDLAFFWYKCLI